jgi:hypothetical protein
MEILHHTFVSTYEGFMFKCLALMCSVRLLLPVKHFTIPCTNKILDVLMDGTYVLRKIRIFGELRHSLHTHI